MNKAQATYFIIVAVVLLLVMVVLLYVFSSQDKIQVTTEGSPIPALPAIENYVRSCIDLVATKGVYHLAYKGGYVNAKGDPLYGEPGDGRRNHYHTRDTIVPYAVDGDEVLLRPLDQISEMLGRYVLVNLDSCLDMSSYAKQGLTVRTPQIDYSLQGFDDLRVPYSDQPVSADATIQDDQITLEVSYPIEVSNQRGRAVLSRAVTSLPLRLGRLHQITGALLSEANDYNPYDLAQHCKKYGASDGKINIYLDDNPYYQDHLLQVVDAAPLDDGFTPLRLQVGVLNVNLTGVCTG